MVDLHSHLIFGVDDGSKSSEMSINMLRQAVDGGTEKIVLTPHYFSGIYEVPIGEIREKAKELRLLAMNNKIDIRIYYGQEVYFLAKILDYLNDNLIGTINESKYMLIEFNMRDFSIKEVIDVLYELQLKGIVPVIAHPERYHNFIKRSCRISG